MELRINKDRLEEVEGIRPEYPYAWHYVEQHGGTVPWHWHEEVELNYVVHGSIQVRTVNQCLEFHENEAFFTNTNVLCSMEIQGDFVMHSHLFHATFLAGHFKSIFETKYLDPVIQNRRLEIVEIRGKSKEQQQMLEKIKQLSRLQEQPDVEFQTRNLLSDIWMLLLSEIRNLDEKDIPAVSVKQERILTMLSFIHSNYQEKLTLEQIAGSAAVSKRECLRCFQNSIQKTPFDYLMDYRMEMAKKLLTTTAMSVVEIAMHSGVTSGAYFTKKFREYYGMTPSEYRKTKTTK